VKYVEFYGQHGVLFQMIELFTDQWKALMYRQQPYWSYKISVNPSVRTFYMVLRKVYNPQHHCASRPLSEGFQNNALSICCHFDRLCGLVVRVLDYRSGGPDSTPGTTRKKVVRLERGPLSLLSTTEELLDRKGAAPV
jgi:hypothetical protein